MTNREIEVIQVQVIGTKDVETDGVQRQAQVAIEIEPVEEPKTDSFVWLQTRNGLPPITQTGARLTPDEARRIAAALNNAADQASS